MLKRRKVKAMYVTQIVCEQCGEEMRCTHTLCTYPAIYCYECRNCNTSDSSRVPSGTVEYEFEEDICNS